MRIESKSESWQGVYVTLVCDKCAYRDTLRLPSYEFLPAEITERVRDFDRCPRCGNVQEID